MSPFPYFQAQVGHFLKRQVDSPLSQKWTACIVTSRRCHFAGRVSNKKAESYYYAWASLSSTSAKLVHCNTWTWWNFLHAIKLNLHKGKFEIFVSYFHNLGINVESKISINDLSWLDFGLAWDLKLQQLLTYLLDRLFRHSETKIFCFPKNNHKKICSILNQKCNVL